METSISLVTAMRMWLLWHILDVKVDGSLIYMVVMATVLDENVDNSLKAIICYANDKFSW